MLRMVEMSLAIATFFAMWSLGQDETAKTIELGGPRKVITQVAQKGERFEVAVGMLAVSCFDPATNKRLNREKAIRYVHLAITQYLGLEGKASSQLTLSGLSTQSTSLDKNRFNLTVVFPFPSDVSNLGALLASDESKVSATTDRPTAVVNTKVGVEKALAVRTRLLQAAEDFIETSHCLLQARKSDVPSLPEPEDEAGRDAFFSSIADLEEQAEKDFDTLSLEVEHSKLLLSIEVKEVLRKIRADRDAFDGLLRESVALLNDPENENKPRMP